MPPVSNETKGDILTEVYGEVGMKLGTGASLELTQIAMAVEATFSAIDRLTKRAPLNPPG